MKKILLVHNKYSLPGGEDSVFEAEQALLKQLGYSVITYVRSNNEFYKYGLLRKLKFILKDFFWSSQTYSEINKICKKEKPDIAHFHNTFFMISPSAYKACQINKVKVVKTLHNYRLLCPNALFYSKEGTCQKCINANFFNALIQKCWRNSIVLTFFSVLFIMHCRIFRIYDRYVDRFVALSEFSKSRFAESLIKPDRIFVKPNFIINEPIKRSEVGDYILYVGALSEYKGVNDVVYAAKNCPHLKFKVVGSGPMEAKISHSIEENELDNLGLIGQCDNAQVLDYINKSMFLLVPSKCYENFPRVLVEAYASGVPVLAPATPVFQEILCNSAVWSYDSREELIEKLKELCQDKKLILTAGKDVYECYLKKYSVMNQRELFEQIYSV